jgi:hypothetical protein
VFFSVLISGGIIIGAFLSNHNFSVVFVRVTLVAPHLNHKTKGKLFKVSWLTGIHNEFCSAGLVIKQLHSVHGVGVVEQ